MVGADYMPRRMPHKINYMDMQIPFDQFKIHMSKESRAKLAERFEAEFGEYELDPWIDPMNEMDMRAHYIYEPNSLELKIERIRVRREMKFGLAKAMAENDTKMIEFYNSLRELPPLPESEDGWNIIPAMESMDEVYRRRIQNE